MREAAAIAATSAVRAKMLGWEIINNSSRKRSFERAKMKLKGIAGQLSQPEAPPAPNSRNLSRHCLRLVCEKSRFLLQNTNRIETASLPPCPWVQHSSNLIIKA